YLDKMEIRDENYIPSLSVVFQSKEIQKEVISMSFSLNDLGFGVDIKKQITDEIDLNLFKKTSQIPERFVSDNIEFHKEWMQYMRNTRMSTSNLILRPFGLPKNNLPNSIIQHSESFIFMDKFFLDSFIFVNSPDSMGLIIENI